MKKGFLLFSLLFIFFLNSYAQEETLTNKSIVDLSELGFSDDLIITKIKTSKTDFDTSTEALKNLKEAGISDAIIKIMMNVEHDNTSNSEQAEAKTGIYTKINGEFIKVLPTVFSGTKTNMLASAFTYGIADTNIKSTLAGSTSRNIIPYNKPEFFFYFAETQNNAFTIGAANWWFMSSTSPNELALVRLSQKRNKRELKTGKVNVYAGSEIGIDSKSTIEFNIIQIDEHTFKVIPDQPLPPGEYCFFYQGTIPHAGFVNQSVFDFSIQPNE